MIGRRRTGPCAGSALGRSDSALDLHEQPGTRHHSERLLRMPPAEGQRLQGAAAGGAAVLVQARWRIVN
eukprot:6210445-Pleurochrysis_carterae.AAC.4